MSRGILTISYGAKKYIRMGKALARSIRRVNTDVALAVITDSEDEDLHSLYDIIIPFRQEFGSGVKQKLYLDIYTPFAETIFIDSDCLVYSDPEALWEMYRSHGSGFAMKGWGYLGPDDSHYSIRNLRQFLADHEVERIPVFNSGVFYFDSSAADSLAVFKTARELCDDTAELKPFGNSNLNDEPVLAMAMAIHGIDIMPWDNSWPMATLSGQISDHLGINVLKGRSSFRKNGNRVDPMILHFHIKCQEYFMYYREVCRLELMDTPLASSLASLLALPHYLASRTRFYRARVPQRLREYGLLGLLPVPQSCVSRLCGLLARGTRSSGD